MNVLQDVKMCKKCKRSLPIYEFNKRAKSKDGLQEWCKSCQYESYLRRNRALKMRKANNNFSMLSYYKSHYGLKYWFLDKKQKGQNRNKIEYQCLKCGKTIISSISEAVKNKFICSKCSCNNTNIEHNEIEKQINKPCNCENHSNHYELSGYNDIGTLLNELMNKDEQEMIREYNNRKHVVKVLIIPVHQPQKQQVLFSKTVVRPPKKQNRFVRWMKNLFGKNDLK